MDITKVKEILRVNNDYASQYYLGLFDNDVFWGLLEQAVEKENNTQEIFKEVLKEGYSLEDFQNCLTMLLESPFNVSGYKRWLLPNKLQFPFISTQTIANTDCNQYFFVLRIEEQMACFEEIQAKITIKSNILNCRETLRRFEQDNQRFLFTFETDVIRVSCEDDCLDLMSFKQLQIDTIIGEENEIDIIGEAAVLEDLYEKLRRYTYNVNEKAYVLNRLTQLSEAINKLPKCYQESLIVKYVSREEGKWFSENGVETLSDLTQTHKLYFISKQFIDALYASLHKRQYEYPIDILLFILKKLKLKQAEVVIARYFGGKVETLESVGISYGQTRELIRQVEKKAATKLVPYRGEIKRFKEELYLCSSYEHFITKEELNALNIPVSCFVFLAKVSNLLAWDDNLEVLLFSTEEMGDGINVCLSEIDNLPSLIPTEDYATCINRIFCNTHGVYSEEEIKYLVGKIYTCHGAVYANKRLRMGDVISFIMDTYFPDGISLYDDDSIRLFREKAREHFNGFEFTDKDRAVRARMQDFCVPIGRGIWKLDKHEMLIPVSLQRRIEQYIENYKISVVPITAVFLAFSEEFVAVGIENRYHLQGQLKLLLQNKYTLTRDYILKGADSNLYSMVEDYVKQSTKLVTKQDIMAEFPGITEVTIGQISQATGVMNMNGYYVHIDNLNLTDNDITNLKEAIDSVLVDDSIYHTKTIYNVCKTRMEGLFSRIGLNHYLQLYYLIHELFPNDYEFNRPYIAILGVEVIGAEAQLVAKIAPRDITTIAEIREFAKQVGMIIDRYIPFIDRNNDTFVFMNENTVVSLEYLEVSEDLFNGLDVVLSEFIGLESYRPLNEFFDYWKLPQLKIPWSEWLLYSIVNKYSSEYSVRVSSNVLAEAVPILVADTFDDSESDFSEIKKVKLDIQDEVLDMLDIDDLIGGDDLE